MKILVIELEGEDPGQLFKSERLQNIQRLMELGCYGQFESTLPLGDVPAPASQSNDRGQVTLSSANSFDPVFGETFWDQIESLGKQVILVGDSLNDSQDSHQQDFDSLQQVAEESQSRFARLRLLMQSKSWDCAQLVDIGQGRLRRVSREMLDRYRDILGDYYLYLDQELGKVLELLSDDTVILILSTLGVPGSDDSDPRQSGSFILTSSNNPLHGEISGVNMLDLPPTLLELAGYSFPLATQGRSLVTGLDLVSPGYTMSDEEIIRERLEGLGYI